MRPTHRVCLRGWLLYIVIVHHAACWPRHSVERAMGWINFFKKIIEGACRLKFFASRKKVWQRIFYVDRFSKKIKSARAKLLCLDFLFLFHLRKKKNNFLTIGTFFLSWHRKNQRSQGFINFWRNHSYSQAESLNSFAEGANSNNKASSHKPNKKAELNGKPPNVRCFFVSAFESRMISLSKIYEANPPCVLGR